MIGRFGRCAYQAAFGVTTGTCEIGRAKCTADMTALTGHVGMCAVQNKAGTKVIKCGLRADIFRHEQTEKRN